MQIMQSLWVEKYRPRTIGDLVLPEQYKKDFEICIERKEIADLLLFGPPGSGKTSLGLILASKNGIIEHQDNVLFINGSAKETRGIGFVSSVIEPYLKVPPSGNDRYKIVFIDEADYLCLDGETEVKILENDKVVNMKIKELKNKSEIKVMSVNLENNNIEEDFAIYVDSGFAEMFEVELEDGTKVICSEKHPFFIMDSDEKLIEKQLRELSEDSKIVLLEEHT